MLTPPQQPLKAENWARKKPKKRFASAVSGVILSPVNNNLRSAIEKIVANGAAIVSFDYTKKDGTTTRRNGVIGYTPFGERAWGQHTSKSIVVSAAGEEFVTVKTNNEDTPTGHAYKSFNLAQISNFTHKGETL